MDKDASKRIAEKEALDRVLASAEFSRSERLSSFLNYVCGVTFEQSTVRLTEQHIGVKVFGRPDNYIPGEDTIVRTTAAMLRKRLAKYYESEGQADPVRIAIPRGSYTPVFVPHCGADAAASAPAAESDAGAVESETVQEPVATRPTLLARIRARLGARRLAGLIGTGCAILLAMLAANLAPASAGSDPIDVFWHSLLNADQQTLFVPADSELVMYQNATGREVSLDDYIAKRFEAPEADTATNTAPAFRWRRYTGVISVTLAMELGKLSTDAPQRLRVRYARDLQLTDLKQSNAILVGIPSANPWVHLFRNRLNYHIDRDPAAEKLLVRNDVPGPGETPLYEFSDRDRDRRGFAILAYTPNLSGNGHVLMVGGTSSAGTEAAVDFLLDREQLREVLAKARNPDGTIGQFEVLLECTMQASGSTDVRVLGVRAKPA